MTPSSRPRRTSTRSSATASAAPGASTCPATRAARAPTRACATRSASDALRSTSRRTSRASTSARRRRPTSAPSSSPPRPTARARTWFLTNGATQGNHALCLALAPLGAPVVAQRNSHASLVDGLVLSGGLPAFVAPEYDAELGMAHGVTPEALAAALDARAGRARRVHRLADLLRHGRRRRGLRRGRARRAACRSSSTRPGARTSASTDALPPSALALGADAVLTSTHKIVGSLTQSAMLHVGRRRPDRRRRGRARRAARALDEPVARCCWPRSTPRAASSRSTARSSCTRRSRRSRRRATKLRVDRRHRADRRASSSGRPGVAGWDPLRIVLDVRGTGCTGYEVADALRETLRRPRRARDARDDRPRPRHRRARRDALERFAGDVDETVRRISRPGTATALVRRPRARERAGRRRRARRSSATPRSSPVDDAVGRDLVRVDRRLPAGHPGAAAGRARSPSEIVAYLRELRRRRRAPARRERPGVRDDARPRRGLDRLGLQRGRVGRRSVGARARRPSSGRARATTGRYGAALRAQRRSSARRTAGQLLAFMSGSFAAAC